MPRIGMSLVLPDLKGQLDHWGQQVPLARKAQPILKDRPEKQGLRDRQDRERFLSSIAKEKRSGR
jgi:hypothetical protein